MRRFSKAQSTTMRAFQELHRSVGVPGALTTAQKELIAAAIAVVQGCDDCIGLHVEAALTAGAGRAAVEEALGVAVLMGDGPALMHAGHALQALDELAPAGPTCSDTGTCSG